MEQLTKYLKNPQTIIEKKLEGFTFSYRVHNPDLGATNIPRHVHPYYELMYIDGGEVEFMVENRRYILKKGDVLIVKPAQYHYARRLFAVPYARYCIGFAPEFTFDKKFTEEILEAGEKFSIEDGSPFAEMAKILREKARTTSTHDVVFFQSMIDAMLISLEDAKPELDGIIAGENNFQKILTHINRHLTTIKSVDDISSALFFSKSYIMHLFKSELRVGVMQYVRNKKILLAHQKIRKGEKPTEVYAKCGFSNYPSFYRAYCAYFGESPKCAKTVE